MSEPSRQRPYRFNGNVALQARLRLGLTQRNVAERCKELASVTVQDSNLSKYERGDACPSPPVLAAIASVLGVAVDDLITLREDAA